MPPPKVESHATRFTVREDLYLLSLAAIYELAQIVGSMAVVTSLVFVGLELRRNTRVTRAASHHAVTASLNTLNMFWAGNAEVTRIWLAGLSGRNALTPEGRWRFDSMLRSYLHVCETMFVQAALGTGDKSIVTAEENGIEQVFASQSARDWWKDNPYGYSTAFRTYINDLIIDLVDVQTTGNLCNAVDVRPDA
jgi:hypothetical protein